MVKRAESQLQNLRLHSGIRFILSAGLVSELRTARGVSRNDFLECAKTRRLEHIEVESGPHGLYRWQRRSSGETPKSRTVQ
jgi:hypothetical protein